MMNRQKRNVLNDLFEDWKNGKGIFYYIDQLEIPETEPQIPWKEAIDAILLDWEYHGNRSGTKIVSPLLSRIVTETGLSEEQKEQLASLVWYKFRKNWTSLWATTTATYNPIENYSMTEHRTHGDQQDGTNGTDSGTFNRVRGFNSSSDVDSDSSEAHAAGNQHLTTNGYEDITRSGNIGVTTSQQMIQSERDLWDWNFFDQVFKDLDSILAIPEYGCPGDGIYYTPGSGYVLPVATAAVLGGVKAKAKTTESGEIAVDSDGKLWYVPGGDPDPYVLPVATAAVLGGVKAKAKTTESGEIAVDSDGKLWYVPGGDAPVQSVNGLTGAVVLDNEDVGAPSQAQFTGLSADVEDNTENIGDLMEAVPFRFGVDSQGNYGYYKAGADTVTPFSAAGSSGLLSTIIHTGAAGDVDTFNFPELAGKQILSVRLRRDPTQTDTGRVITFLLYDRQLLIDIYPVLSLTGNDGSSFVILYRLTSTSVRGIAFDDVTEPRRGESGLNTTNGATYAVIRSDGTIKTINTLGTSSSSYGLAADTDYYLDISYK